MAKLDDPTNPDPGGDPLSGGQPEPTTDPDAAPTSELQEWRRRALEAEALVDQLSAEVHTLRAQIDSSDRTRAVDALLSDAGALDIAAARAVLDAQLAQRTSDEPADLASSVDALRRTLPFLFRAPHASSPSPRAAMPAAANADTPNFDDLDAALELAATTGDRAALLRYLRLRRAV